jgi:hypothetical protein
LLAVAAVKGTCQWHRLTSLCAVTRTIAFLLAHYASADRRDVAVRTGSEAVRLLEQAPANASAVDVRARLDLYRRHIAFIVPNP